MTTTPRMLSRRFLGRRSAVALGAGAALLGLWTMLAAHPALADPLLAITPLQSSPLVIPFQAPAGNSLSPVGGLSGITFAGNNTYYAVLDNQGSSPARYFTLAFRVDESGAAPLTPGQSGADVPTGVTQLGTTFTGANFDAEGIALIPGGTLFVSAESDPSLATPNSAPSIREFTLGGTQIGSALDIPSQFVRDAAGTQGVRGNLAFESLAVSGDGNTLFTANEQALIQDGPLATTAAGTPVRLLRYSRSGGGAFTPGAQFVYNVSPIGATPIPPGGFADRGLVDLLTLPGGDLLSLERSFVQGVGNTIQIFQVSLAGATDVSGLHSLAGQSFTPVTKTLLFDFAGSGFAPDNIEGFTFGPTLGNGDRTLVVVSDNNFSSAQQTQIAALRLSQAVIPEPGTLALLGMAGLPLAGAALRKRARRTPAQRRA